MTDNVTSESGGVSNSDQEFRMASVKSPTDRTKSAWKQDLVFVLFAILYILPFMRVLMVGTDEGTLDYGALRILQGQVFARDFFEVIGPGTFYWLAGFFKVFGVTFLSTRICLFVTSIGTAYLMYYLSRRTCGKYRALPCIILAATSFGGLWPAISHHDDSNLFALAAVASIDLWERRNLKWLLILGGLMAGCTTAILQPKGILLIIGLLAFLVIQRRLGGGLISSLGLVLGGYTFILGAIILYFWRMAALHDLIFANVIWPSAHYGTVNAVSYAHGILFNYWDHWMGARAVFPGIIVLALVMMVPIIYVAGLPVLLPLLGASVRWNWKQPQIRLLWLSGIAVWVSELHRTDMTHLVFGSPILIILSIHYLSAYANKSAMMLLQALTISSVCLAGFNLLVLTAAHTVQTRMGSIRMFTDWRSHVFVEQNIPAGEEIFAYPYNPSFYFMHGLTNPTRFSLLTYNYNTSDQFEEVVQVLDSKKIKYVIWDVGFQHAEANVFLTGVISREQQIVEPYLESHYDIVTVIDGKRIMRRKAAIDEHH